VSTARDIALMNSDFFSTEEDVVMATFIHLQFLINKWNSFCRCFRPRDSIRVFLKTRHCLDCMVFSQKLSSSFCVFHHRILLVPT